MKALIYIILLTLAICFVSCRTQYIPVETVRTEYRVRDSIRHDSVYQQDSVYVLVKGDTVYQYRYKYLYKYQYLNRTDTVIKIDSVQVPYPVEKQLSRWQSIKMELGGWAFGLVIAFVLIIIGRIVYRYKNK
ncbi:hypothetical protein [Bacteroides xylanisolvens]|jgi:hypothetical protein|uniref:hypothetical protein n=1 Tax=Bacteroides xylanisolvens TaxID=371601 RepID=UPI001C8B2040|nr:hypothetical protein [Bacteroides xylanisolvens]